MVKKLACKVTIFMKFYYELYSDDRSSSHYLETLRSSNTLIVTYCQKVSLSQPQFIKHNFFVQKVKLCYQRWQNTTLNSNKWISNSHRTCLSVSNKWISAVYETQNLPLYFKPANFKCNSHRTWLCLS